MSRGHLVLEHPIEQIADPHAFRQELGDLTELRRSIETVGLLTPVTISVNHVLISGRRRLAVMRELGHTRVPVWIAAGVSDELQELLAIKDAHILRKTLTPSEQAGLYAELKSLLAEEAARKQLASRFGASAPTGVNGDADPEVSTGGWDSQPPPYRRKSRVQAAQAVTGRDSSQQLEQVLELQRLAVDEQVDPRVRQAAAEAVIAVDTDRKVAGRYLDVKNLQATLWLERVADDPGYPLTVREAAATQARELARIENRVEQAREAVRGTGRIAALLADPAEAADPVEAARMRERFQCERVAALLSRQQEWWVAQDPQVLGRYATDREWELICTHLDGAASFLDAARTARQAARA